MSSMMANSKSTQFVVVDTSINQSLLNSDSLDEHPQVLTRQSSWTAWWILLWYSYLSGLQSLLWFTFSSVPDESRSYLGVDDATLDLWLDYGPIGYCVSIFFALWLLSSRRDGLRLSVILASVLCLLSSIVRLLPLWLPASSRSGALAAIHIGQLMNGMVAPLVVASPSYLSLLWFPENSRNTATAIGNVSNAVGRGIGFFLGPAIVTAAADLPTLLYLEVGLAALPLIAVLAYYPASPGEPPSRAAAEEMQLMEQKLSSKSSSSSSSPSSASLGWVSEVWRSLAIPSFLLLAIGGGLEMAAYGGWSGVLTSALTPRFSDSQAGAMGSVNTFAGILGGLAAGLVTDHPRLRHHLKSTVQALAVSSAAFFALLALSVPPFAQASLVSALPFPALAVICAVAGLLRGGTDPLFFELVSEVVHPAGVSPGLAGGVLTFWYHVILCIMLSVPPDFLQHWLMVAMAAFMLLSAVMLVSVKVTYTRR